MSKERIDPKPKFVHDELAPTDGRTGVTGRNPTPEPTPAPAPAPPAVPKAKAPSKKSLFSKRSTETE